MADAGDSKLVTVQKPKAVKQAASYGAPTEAQANSVVGTKPTRKSNGNLGRGMR